VLSGSLFPVARCAGGANLPVAELIKFEFVINLKRPRALGLPLNLLITAAEVIDNDTATRSPQTPDPHRRRTG